MGVVRAMAGLDHRLLVSRPRSVRASGKVTSNCQRGANHSRISVGSADRRVQRRYRGQQASSGFGPALSGWGRPICPSDTRRRSGTRAPRCGWRRRLVRLRLRRAGPWPESRPPAGLGLLPGWIGEQRCEGSEYQSNDIRQGEHGRAFREKLRQHRLPCLHTVLTTRKVQLSPGPVIWNPWAVPRHHDGGISRPQAGHGTDTPSGSSSFERNW